MGRVKKYPKFHIYNNLFLNKNKIKIIGITCNDIRKTIYLKLKFLCLKTDHKLFFDNCNGEIVKNCTRGNNY